METNHSLSSCRDPKVESVCLHQHRPLAGHEGENPTSKDLIDKERKNEPNRGRQLDEDRASIWMPPLSRSLFAGANGPMEGSAGLPASQPVTSPSASLSVRPPVCAFFIASQRSQRVESGASGDVCVPL